MSERRFLDRSLATVLLAIGGIALILAVAVDQLRAFVIDRQTQSPPSDPSRLAMPEPSKWRAKALEIGSPAPAFRLMDVRTGSLVSLDEYRGRPVVLLLSSFGCNVFCNELGRLIALHKALANQAEFVFIAIRDAGHPDPKTSPPTFEPRSNEEPSAARVREIREGVEFLKLPFQTLIDLDGKLESQYEAFPKRLVIIGPDGLIVYDGGRGATGGPSDWDLAEAERQIRAISAANPKNSR